MATQTQTLEKIRDTICMVALKYGVDRVILFGSYARGEEHDDSDIDILIDRGAIKGLFQFAAFQRELQERLKKPVDVLTKASLSQRFLEEIQDEEVLLYERS